VKSQALLQRKQIIHLLVGVLTQYNFEDIPIETRGTSKPSSDIVDDLDKTIMTALLQFYTKFGSAKIDNSIEKWIAKTMLELSTTHIDGESFSG